MSEVIGWVGVGGLPPTLVVWSYLDSSPELIDL